MQVTLVVPTPVSAVRHPRVEVGFITVTSSSGRSEDHVNRSLGVEMLFSASAITSE